MQIAKMDEELEVLRKLLYQHKSQHGHTKYFQLTRYGRKLLGKLKNIEQPKEKLVIAEKAREQFLKACVHFSELLAKGWFVEISLVYLAVCGNLLKILDDEVIVHIKLLVDKEKERKERADLKRLKHGERISRKSPIPKNDSVLKPGKACVKVDGPGKDAPSTDISCGVADTSEIKGKIVKSDKKICEKKIKRRKIGEPRKEEGSMLETGKQRKRHVAEIDDIFGEKKKKKKKKKKSKDAIDDIFG
mmetsp:Transcript_35912/g.57327  ORF Transcript_35912/g.57327 Transcript_35912/m.57327 type:complete len:246 (-) Transcript_35912:1934-2671(-)